MNRQKKALLLLFCLLLLAIAYSYWMMPVQRRVSPAAIDTGSGQSAGPRSGAVQTGKTRVRVDLLEKESTRYKGYKRDIFNFVVVKPKAPSKPAPLPKPVVKPPPQVQKSRVTQTVRKQLARFTFLGFLVKDTVHTVFLSRGEELYLVQEGDRFGDDDQFTAVSISPEKMSINQTGDPRPIEITLIEKEPLIPAMQQDDATVTPAPPPQDQPANKAGWRSTPGRQKR